VSYHVVLPEDVEPYPDNPFFTFLCALRREPPPQFDFVVRRADEQNDAREMSADLHEFFARAAEQASKVRLRNAAVPVHALTPDDAAFFFYEPDGSTDELWSFVRALQQPKNESAVTLDEVVTRADGSFDTAVPNRSDTWIEIEQTASESLEEP